MNKFFLIFSVFLLLSFYVSAQETVTTIATPVENEPRVAVTLGILEGGGSMLGADFEVMLNKRVSVQAGTGFTGFGAGLNYHLKPQINSSMLSLTYWHQGIGKTYTQSVLGPTYVFRAKKIFTAQIGMGYVVEEGPAWPASMTHPPVILLYAIGIYLPVK